MYLELLFYLPQFYKDNVMSNITVYSTPSILADSSFLNNFLDSLLENYCSANFTPNVAYPSVNITLEKLIQLNLIIYKCYFKPDK